MTPIATHAATTIPLESDDIFWANDSTGNQLFGSSMARGDINNDGFEDIVIGAPMYDKSSDGADQDVGRVTVVYGNANQWDDGSNDSGTTFTGEGQSNYAGTAVAVSDIDDDGYDDIFIGATGNGSTGAVYLVYGAADTLSSMDLNNAAFKKFTGQAGGHVGNALAGGGDINNDGADDIIVGDQDIDSLTGAVYVKYGKTDHTRFISSTFTSNDIKISGIESQDFAGSSLALGGDMNGDGYDDILIGACECGSDSTHTGGKAFVIYGDSTGNLGSTIALSSAITLTGEATGDKAGLSVSFAGDINNDGYADALIGAPANDSAFTDGGAAYILYGSSTRVTSKSLGHSSIIKLSGSRAEGNTGSFVTGGRDINNDSYPDMVIGTPSQVDPGGGRVHVLYGGAALETNQSINTASDLVFDSLVSGQANYTGSSAILGDWNGDGYNDISIGSPHQRVTLTEVGSVHTYYQRIDTDNDGRAANTEHVLFDGTDCDDNDITVHTTYTFYEDQDGDNSGTGNTQTACQGASPSAPSGYALSVANTTDCNDADATISTNQTYYQDSDGDGLGGDETLLSCSITVPDDYVTNSSDTNDTIANNGIEISGDGIDNDNDGTIDEINTLALNGSHPAYRNFSLSSSDEYKAAIRSVSARSHGVIRVTFTDNSIFDYTIFTTTTSKKTLYKNISNTGRIVAVSENGKTIRTVNLFTGAIIDSEAGIKSKKHFVTHALAIKDMRSDGSKEIILTSRDAQSTAHVAMLRIASNNTLKVQARKEMTNTPLDVKKTRFKSTVIELKNNKGRVLKTLTLNKNYQLSVR